VLSELRAQAAPDRYREAVKTAARTIEAALGWDHDPELAA
jgi:hypothetical protein